MLSGEMARYRIADRVRDAEVARLARSTRRGKELETRGFARRIGRAALAVALWAVRQ